MDNNDASRGRGHQSPTPTFPGLDSDAKAQLTALLDAAVDAIIVIDHLGRIESFNAAAQRIFGYINHEVIGKNVSMLMPEPYKSGHDDYIDNYNRTGKAKIIGIGREVSALRKNGEVFAINLSVGEVKGSSHRQFVGIIRDISEDVKVRQEIQENREKLLHISRISTMGEMAAGLAHEINQPLTAVATYAQACHRLFKSGSADKDKILDILSKINAQALRAGEVIKRLRGFVKNGAQTRELVDINSLLLDAVRLVLKDTRLGEDNVDLQLSQTPIPVVVDAVQIQQLLINLIRNAADAMDNVAANLIVIRVNQRDQDWVEVEVMDSGEGVKEENILSLFDPFFTTKKSGMGMGLKICQTIVNAHGGKLWHSNNEPCGSVFTFSLPIVAPFTDGDNV